jgi:DNA-binding response OmpR family regulator
MSKDRIRVLVVDGEPKSRPQGPQPTFKTGDLLVDCACRRVFVGGQEVKLIPTEYRLLCELAGQAGPDPHNLQYVQTRPGLGYVFAPLE